MCTTLFNEQVLQIQSIYKCIYVEGKYILWLSPPCWADAVKNRFGTYPIKHVHKQ